MGIMDILHLIRDGRDRPQGVGPQRELGKLMLPTRGEGSNPYSSGITNVEKIGVCMELINSLCMDPKFYRRHGADLHRLLILLRLMESVEVGHVDTSSNGYR